MGQAFTELVTENIMKILLVIALFGAVQAKPWFYGHYPVVYHAPTVYASNVCRNAAGAVVACAEGTAGGIYKFADAPATFGLHGLAVAPAAAEERKKRDAEPEAEAEADPWLLYSGYYGHPGYYGYGYGLGYGWVDTMDSDIMEDVATTK